MPNRRDFLRETSHGFVTLGVGALAGTSITGRAYAQGKASKKRKPAASPTPEVRASEAVNKALAPVRDAHHLPGLVGAVVRGGLLESIGAVGVRKVGSPEPIQVDDQMHLGSNTKAMTATMIATIVDEKKLTWSTTLREVFPDQASKFHPGFQAVTLWELLTHRAGLPENGPWGDFPQDRSTTDQRREVLSRMLRPAPQTKPGTRFAYSNVGYVLAGLMAEQVTGRSWETLMKERLFEPLEMTSAGFGTPGAPGEIGQPWGHLPKDDRFEPEQSDNPPVMGPAGTVHCTVPDWAKFAVLHMRAAQGKFRLLKPATFRKLHSPPSGSTYAGGWNVIEQPWTKGLALTHAGSNTLWFVIVWIVPSRNFSILVASNGGGAGAQVGCDEAVRALIKYHLSSNPR